MGAKWAVLRHHLRVSGASTENDDRCRGNDHDQAGAFRPAEPVILFRIGHEKFVELVDDKPEHGSP